MIWNFRIIFVCLLIILTKILLYQIFLICQEVIGWILEKISSSSNVVVVSIEPNIGLKFFFLKGKKFLFHSTIFLILLSPSTLMMMMMIQIDVTLKPLKIKEKMMNITYVNSNHVVFFWILVKKKIFKASLWFFSF